MSNKLLTKCCVCGSSTLETIIDLPNLPLTGIYYPTKDLSIKSPKYDQALNICSKCGHGQLKQAIDPLIVYDNTYTHRSSSSSISVGGNDFFANKLKIFDSLGKDKVLLEIGCNDGYLLKQLSPKIKFGYGIDPIWINHKPIHKDNYKIIGGYCADLKKILSKDIKPNLIVSSHTFEHTVNLFEDLSTLVEIANDDCIFHIEMPSLETLIRLRRFDQVFHQHIQYISENSIKKLVKRLNCQLLKINYNYSLWGGTVMFTFTNSKVKKDLKLHNNALNYELDLDIKNALDEFRIYINLLTSQISSFESFCYLGAAQMLPIVDYHTPEGFNPSFILDDNKTRIDSFLPNMPYKIKPMKDYDVSMMENTALVLGAIDSSKSIVKRCKELNMINVFSIFQNLI